jgi:aminoglycoside 2'-N-acetyltransferase I
MELYLTSRLHYLDLVELGVKRVRDVQPAELDEWRRLVERVHLPGEPRLGSDLRWADVNDETDYFVRARENGELRASAWVTKQTVSVAGEQTTVAGIRGVLTDPDHRRRGYGRAVVEKAQELMRSYGDCDVALLFSSEMAVPLYESLGWLRVEGPVTCEQPGGRITYTDTLPPTAPVMALLLRMHAELPRGPIDLHGLPW